MKAIWTSSFQGHSSGYKIPGCTWMERMTQRRKKDGKISKLYLFLQSRASNNSYQALGCSFLENK